MVIETLHIDDNFNSLCIITIQFMSVNFYVCMHVLLLPSFVNYSISGVT